MQHLQFLKMAILTNLKLSLTHRMAFFISILLVLAKQILMITAWNFFFAKYNSVKGWHFDDMLLMYGIVSFSVGFVNAFFYGLKQLPRMIESNQLDTFLLQPKNVILNVALSKGDVTSLGEVITGILLIGYSGYLFDSLFSILLILTCGVLFVFSLLLYLSCIGFFMRNSYDFIRELHLNTIIMATQPSAAFTGAFKIFTFTLLPVAFLSFFPIEYLRTGLFQHLLWTVLGTLCFLTLSCLLFKRGLKHYESGNIISFRR